MHNSGNYSLMIHMLFTSVPDNQVSNFTPTHTHQMQLAQQPRPRTSMNTLVTLQYTDFNNLDSHFTPWFLLLFFQGQYY